jgi:hypothetical protein
LKLLENAGWLDIEKGILYFRSSGCRGEGMPNAENIAPAATSACREEFSEVVKKCRVE